MKLKKATGKMSNRALFRDNRELYVSGVQMCTLLRDIARAATAGRPKGIRAALTWRRDALRDIAKMAAPFKDFQPPAIQQDAAVVAEQAKAEGP